MAGISFLSILAVLWGFQVLLGFAEGNIIEEIASTGDQRVNLTCHFNSSTDVIWYIGDSTPLYNCRLNQIDQCTRTLSSELGRTYNDFDLRATRNNETSILSLIPYQKEQSFQCRTENGISQRYRVTVIDPNDIVPNCTVALPSSDVNGKVGVAFVCEIYSLGLDVILTFEEIGSNIPDTPGSSVNTRTKTLDLNDFTNIHSVSCNAYVPGINITRSCNYPNIVKTQYITEGNDIIVECDTESDVDWHLFDSDGKEEDIKIRSWIQEEGRSLLIRHVSEEDVGKVVVCQPRGDISSNGTIVFTVILEISEDINKNNSKDMKPGHSGNDPFFVPTLLFLALWLITTAIFGVWYGCRPRRNKSSSASRNTSIPNSQLNQSSHSESNVNGGAGDREIPLVNARTGSRGDPDTSNTNNSASNNAFELEGDGTHEHGLNRQSNNGSHLYFTLEKPSPSTESSRRTLTSRMDRHEDTDLASLNQPQSSHWQGYEAIGETDKNAACSYDLGEYAEVGDHLIGRSLTDRSVRPSIPKKPGKEEIKENDISRLYSQVNK